MEPFGEFSQALDDGMFEMGAYKILYFATILGAHIDGDAVKHAVLIRN